MEWLMGLPVWLQALFATLFTYAMTALGASFVFLSGRIRPSVLTLMQGSAAGIMIAASFFSLLLPAAERLEHAGAMTALVLGVGFVAGGAFIVCAELLLRRLRGFSDGKRRSGALTFFAMTLHNVPEGFSVGVAFVRSSQAMRRVGWLRRFWHSGSAYRISPKGFVCPFRCEDRDIRRGERFFTGSFPGVLEIAAGVLGAACRRGDLRASAVGALLFRRRHGRCLLRGADPRLLCGRKNTCHGRDRVRVRLDDGVRRRCKIFCMKAYTLRARRQYFRHGNGEKQKYRRKESGGFACGRCKKDGDHRRRVVGDRVRNGAAPHWARIYGRKYFAYALSMQRVKIMRRDVTVGDTLEKAVAEAVKAAGGLYALVYSAGFSMAAPIEYADEKDYRYLFDVNYFGALRALKCAVPHLKKRGGRIVFVSSMGGTFPVAFDSFYSSSKALWICSQKRRRSSLSRIISMSVRYSPEVRRRGSPLKRKIYADEENREYAAKLKRATAALANMEQGGLSAGRSRQAGSGSALRKASASLRPLRRDE